MRYTVTPAPVLIDDTVHHSQTPPIHTPMEGSTVVTACPWTLSEEYLGITTRTSCPRRDSSADSEPTMSPSPPAFT